MLEHLEIPVEGKCSGLRLLIYPQSAKAKVFEEREPYAGESRWQLKGRWDRFLSHTSEQSSSPVPN